MYSTKPSLSSTSSTNRKFRRPSPFRSRNTHNNNHKSTISRSAIHYSAKVNRSTSGVSSSLGSETTPSTTRSNSTPLAALADKFDRFKRRMSTQKKDRNSTTSSLRPSHKNNNNNNKAKTMMSHQYNHHYNQHSQRNKQAQAQHPQQQQQRQYRNDENAMSMEKQTETIYNEVMDGMTKMTSSSRDDATTITASSTQPSFSHDDGSTIVSEDTTSYTYHTFQAGKEQFTVDKKYSMIRTIGSGAYGTVISAKDFQHGTNVAIKMIPRAFHDEIDAKRILREIKLLKHFRHENIISILDMMPPLARHVEDFNDVYIVTDLMETDLHRIIYSKQSLSIDHVQYFLYQVLRALKYMHSANVLHRDLKPSNLLVNSNCDLKVCDFGLARGITEDHDVDLENGNSGSMLLTEYVVTRWYRAPEIMLACHEYSKPSDIWSVGCIFAELLGRKPFFPGDDYIDQVSQIDQGFAHYCPVEFFFTCSNLLIVIIYSIINPISIKSHKIQNTAHNHYRKARQAT